tara:strand:- start:8274 stop:8564 length:291 start_codon:yes stop_codon:yes gene_type:complete
MRRISKDFQNIMKNVFYINISEIFFYIIILIFILISYYGYYLRKQKEPENVKNDIKYVIGSVLFYLFGFFSVILLLPVIINVLVIVIINSGVDELF